MIKLLLIATVAVAATYADPQVVSTTAIPLTAANVVPANYYNQYDPYSRNTYDPYNRYNNIDPYYRNNYFGSDYNNRNYYRNDPYNRNNYYGTNYYNKQLTNGYYPNNYVGAEYYNKNVYKNYPYNKNVYNTEYQKNYVAGPEGRAAILRIENNVNPDGTYQYGYETENGISVEQQGYPVPGADNEAGNGATGSYSYTSPEGIQFQTTYVADGNGYRTQQTNSLRGGLPVAPEAAFKTVAKQAEIKK